MLSLLRKAVAPIKLGLARPLARAKVDPNWVTLSAIPLSLGAMACGATGHYWVGLAFGVPAAMADFLDGPVAELQGRQSPQGNFLEAVVDRVVDGVLLAGLGTRYPLLSFMAVTLSFTVSYIKARVGLVIQSDNSDWPGWGDRTDRVALTLLAYAAAGYSCGAGFSILAILVAVSLVGSVQRLRHGLRLIGQAKQEGTLLPYLR